MNSQSISSGHIIFVRAFTYFHKSRALPASWHIPQVAIILRHCHLVSLRGGDKLRNGTFLLAMATAVYAISKTMLIAIMSDLVSNIASDHTRLELFNPQSAHDSFRLLTMTRIATNTSAHTVRRTPMTIVAVVREGGLTRFGTCPSGGTPAGIAQRSTPGGI